MAADHLLAALELRATTLDPGDVAELAAEGALCGCADAVKANITDILRSDRVSARSVEGFTTVLLAEADQDPVTPDRELTFFSLCAAEVRERITASVAAQTKGDPKMLAPVDTATIIRATRLWGPRHTARDADTPITKEPLCTGQRALKVIAAGLSETALTGRCAVGPTPPRITLLTFDWAGLTGDTALSHHTTPIADTSTRDRLTGKTLLAVCATEPRVAGVSLWDVSVENRAVHDNALIFSRPIRCGALV